MGITFHAEGVDIQLDNVRNIIKWLETVIEKEGKQLGDIKFIFVDDRQILKINKQFLKHQYETDIITFGESFMNVIDGEIYISIETVQRNSIQYAEGNFLLELHRTFIHGILHILGYKDSSEKQKTIMRSKEDEYLNYLDWL